MATPNLEGSASYSPAHRCQSVEASSVSTLESRNSITSFLEWRTRSVSVRTFMPSSTRREQDGTSTLEPSTSTMHTRHAFTGVRLSA
jgi:hypothetical protein